MEHLTTLLGQLQRAAECPETKEFVSAVCKDFSQLLNYAKQQNKPRPRTPEDLLPVDQAELIANLKARRHEVKTSAEFGASDFYDGMVKAYTNVLKSLGIDVE